MKADVIPPRLDIPSWVPEPIARYASYRYGADVGRPCQAALKSLACDPRMKGVWRQLSRRARNGAFLYPQLREVLMQQAGDRRGEIDTRTLGNWLMSICGRIRDGHCIAQVKKDRAHGNRYALLQSTRS